MLSLNFEKKITSEEKIQSRVERECSRLSKHRVAWHKSDLAKRVINSSDAEEDWDSETYGRKLNTRNYTVTIYFITLL
jgi:hypothetical protein